MLNRSAASRYLNHGVKILPKKESTPNGSFQSLGLYSAILQGFFNFLYYVSVATFVASLLIAFVVRM